MTELWTAQRGLYNSEGQLIGRVHAHRPVPDILSTDPPLPETDPPELE